MASHLLHCRGRPADKSETMLILFSSSVIKPVKTAVAIQTFIPRADSMRERSTKHSDFYSGTVLALLTLAALFSASASDAYAAGGFWQIEGQLINVDQLGLNSRECEQSNTMLRFRSRWSNGEGCIAGPTGECPWGVWWGTTATNASGRFNKTSPFLLDLSRSRDIQVQYRDQANQWKTITVVSDIGNPPTNQQNNHVWRFNLGTLKTTHFKCPTVLVPSRRNSVPKLQPITDPNPNADVKIEAIDQHEDAEAAPSSPTITEIPCGMDHQGASSYDLAFESTAVRHRDNQPDAPIERITWEVVIRNNGTAAYKPSGKCRTTVRMSVYLPELSATRVYEITLRGSIQPGEARKFTSNSGNLGEISEAASTSYNLKFEIDPENKVMESNEGNNFQPGCYTPTTGNYVDTVSS